MSTDLDSFSFLQIRPFLRSFLALSATIGCGAPLLKIVWVPMVDHIMVLFKFVKIVQKDAASFFLMLHLDTDQLIFCKGKLLFQVGVYL